MPVMVAQRVATEVVFEIAVSRVVVVRVVLSVSVFDREGGSLNAVVVALVHCGGACPSED